MPVAHLSDTDFDEKTKEGVVLVDFWAQWCGPCRQIAPVLDEISDELGDRATIAKVNVEEAPGLAQRFRVMGIPAFLIMKDGEVKDQFAGARPKEDLVSAIEAVIAG